MDSQTRRMRYAKISTALAHLDDDALGRLLADRPATQGWGTTLTVEIEGEPVFVKAIPLTDLERDHPYATRNHYALPTFYQYGVGSAGFGAWRELVTHLTTTNWVLAGACEMFPLTYHLRIVRRPSWAEARGLTDLDDTVRRWNGNANIAHYLTERAYGSHVALVFSEQLPHTLRRWLIEHPGDTEHMVRQLSQAVSFMNEHGVYHFDGHLNNAVTDGERPYLVDFGLTLDARFDLTADEREFLARHRYYDHGLAFCSIGAMLGWWYDALDEGRQIDVRQRLGVSDDRDLIVSALTDKVEQVTDLVHPGLVDATAKYRDIIGYTGDFLTRLQKNPRKDTAYDDNKLRVLLENAGVFDR